MRVIVRSISALILCFPFVITAAHAAQDEWYTYRHDSARTGAQPFASDLSDPEKVGTLELKWAWPPGCLKCKGVGAFKSSPIVVDDTVFIGNTNGFFYALDAATGTLKWQYPKASDPPLLGSCDPNGFAGGLGHYGIPSSATYAKINGQDAVIFGAPDPDPRIDSGLGSARLFALPLSPADPNDPQPIWKSDVVAQVTGCTPLNVCNGDPTCISKSYAEKHERIAYSSPLVLGDRVYVGIHDTGDSPIQQGRVVAVDVNSGHIAPQFSFVGTGTPGDGSRGGSVWNALATDGTGVYFTTGNTHDPWCVYPYVNCPSNGPEPSPNNGLSMIRVDKDTGSIAWKYQPVPFGLDGDPDWAAGATVMSTSCGELIASVQKDGWSYAIDAGRGPSLQCPAPPGGGLSPPSWQFPATKKGCTFNETTLQHGDDDYRRPGAAWNDVFIVRTGGEANTDDPPSLCQCEHNAPGCTQGRIACRGYGELHALNACATSEQDRVRWIADIPNIMGGNGHISYSAPTVTGGIVFIGTNQDPSDGMGHLVVLADPSVVPVPASEERCSNDDYLPQNCPVPPFALVPIPKQLVSIAMPDGGSLASMRNEPVLARGRVFVATDAGHVYMLAACKPVVTACPPGACGIFPTGCAGETLECGGCPPPQICVGGGCCNPLTEPCGERCPPGQQFCFKTKTCVPQGRCPSMN
jgi:outer membrane protein assembly factor BamB